MTKGRKVPALSASEQRMQSFVEERNTALLNMDEAEIRAFFKKWQSADMPQDPEVFWRAVHKARTAIPALPAEARAASKRWLIAHGSESFDDGDIQV